MNPNVPSWRQQNQNNPPQPQQPHAYPPQQQAYNPYAAAPPQQPQYNPYAPQQYVPQQPSQQYPPQHAAYNPYSQQPPFQQPQPQFYGQQQQNMNPYRQPQPQAPQQQQQAPQQAAQSFNPQYNQRQPQPFNRYQPNHANVQAPYQNPNQQRPPQAQAQPQGYRNDDNWDHVDDPRRDIKTQNQRSAVNDLDKSDDEQTNANVPQSQTPQKKKKKRRRGGRNKKNKEKDSSVIHSNKDNEVPMAAPPKPKQHNSSNAVSATTAALKDVTLKIEKETAVTKSASSSASLSASSSPPPPQKQNKQKQKQKSKKEKTGAVQKATKGKASAKEEKKEEATGSKKKKKKSKKVVWDAHDPREHLNLVLIGHVDAGKSTISGQILLATNQIDKRTIAKYKKEAKEKNRESWWIAYIMDEDDEERNKGKTVECGRAHFDTDNRRYTILDAPGHKNYVPNMISGAQQADVAILVISARRGEFEAGFDRGGQTREHALLALTLGISRIVIVVNKMDTMEWSKERYMDIKTRVSKFLCDDIGFKKKYIDILPISGQSALNIKEKVTKELCPWYNGDTLIETLDRLKKIKRATGDCLRIPILDRYKGDKGLQAIGKVEAGILKKGDSVMIMPSEVSTVVAGLSIDDAPVESVGAGENVLLTFDKGALSMDQIYSGCVICSAVEPTKVVEHFLAEIYIHEIPGGGIMTSGYQAMFHCHNVATMCEIETIPHKLHRKTMKRSKVAPPFLRSHDRAIAKIKLDEKCALESFDDCAPLGRFTLRDSGKTVVIGKIKEIYASKSRLKNKNEKN